MATHYLLSFLLLLVLSLYIVSLVDGHSSLVDDHSKIKVKYLNKLYKAKGVDKSNFEPYLHDEDVETSYHVESKEKDKIVKLPGQPRVQFDQYGGYITVDQSAGRALFYYFVEAEQDKESLPLLLWLNGGPGCSSLGYGAKQELGPFRVYSDGKTLYKNLFAWNHVANVLFVESPAGVGFSYSNTSSDYHIGDKKTAADNYVFLLNWLKRFPEYKDRDFYISGESYAGHYVPQLAQTILHHNKKAKKTLINLKGIIIGNAVINDETDDNGYYDFSAGHALISDTTLKQIHRYCDFPPIIVKSNPKCDNAKDVARYEISAGIDIFNIYAPLCMNSNLTTRPKKISYEINPCSNDYTRAYLNRPDVQEALHANVTKLDHDWELCSEVLVGWLDSPITIIPILEEIMANGLRVWYFSGDTDAVIPFTSTTYSLKLMKLKVKSFWHPWMTNGQVGGYTEEYEGNLTYATVRGAGHHVPSYQPRRSLALITHFLNGTPLPKSADFPNSITN